MSELKEAKIYCGSGKTIEGKFGEFYKVSICLSDLPKEHTFDYNGKTYVKLEVSKKREADQYGKNVSVCVDTWKPNQDKVEQKSTESNPFETTDSLPF